MSNLKLVGAVLLLIALATLGLRHWTRLGAEAVVGDGPFPSQAKLDEQAGQKSAQSVYEADEVTQRRESALQPEEVKKVLQNPDDPWGAGEPDESKDE